MLSLFATCLLSVSPGTISPPLQDKGEPPVVIKWLRDFFSPPGQISRPQGSGPDPMDLLKILVIPVGLVVIAFGLVLIIRGSQCLFHRLVRWAKKRPPRLSLESREPTQQEEYDQAVAWHDNNRALIDKSPMSPEQKEEAHAREQEQLAKRIHDIME